MQNIPPIGSGQIPSTSEGPKEEGISFTRIISGNLVPVDISNLPNHDQKALQFAKDKFESLQLPPGTYALDSSGKIKNVESGKIYNIAELEHVQETIKILSDNEKEIVVGITAKAKLPDPKVTKALENIINEHLITETAFYNSFGKIVDAMKNDKQAFFQALREGGVTDEEIKLIFEPLEKAAHVVKSFQESLQEIKELRDKAQTSEDYQNVMNAYKQLIDTKYASYADSLHKMMLAQKYYTQFGTQGKTNRIEEAVEIYFKNKGIQNPFGRQGLKMTDMMIGFVQRLPRHELLFKDANEKSTKLGNDYITTLDKIRKKNLSINEDMPPSAQLSISNEVFHIGLKKSLEKQGWKEKDIKEFVTLYNSYNKEIQDLETILFLKDKYPSNYRLSLELNSMAAKKQKTIEALNKRFEKWGGTKKLQELTKAQTDLVDPINLGEKLTAKLGIIDRIYVDETHLAKFPVVDRLFNSQAASKYLHQVVLQLRSNGWTPQDIDRFNSIYVNHARAFTQLQLAFLKAGENLDDPTFKNEAKKIIPKLRSAQRDFNRFGGFAKTERLHQALSNVHSSIKEPELRTSLMEADFHSEINRQMAFWEPLANYLKI